MKKNLFVRFIYFKHRLSHSCPVVTAFLDTIMQLVFKVCIPSSVCIGEGLVLPHFGLGVVINKESTIGKNCVIYQHVIIEADNSTPPCIGSNVIIGAGAKIIGNVQIGDNVKIGANCVVLKDIPSNSTAVGVAQCEN